MYLIQKKHLDCDINLGELLFYCINITFEFMEANGVLVSESRYLLGYFW